MNASRVVRVFVAMAVAPLAVPLPAHAAALEISIGNDEVTENATNEVVAQFEVTLSKASDKKVTVDYETAPGSTTGADFTTKQGSLSFSPGQRSKTMKVPVKDDVLDEFAEDFSVRITDPNRGSISDSKGRGTIVDNDRPPALSFDNVTKPEGNADSSVRFTGELSGPSGKPISVSYETEDDTAEAPSDYVAKDGTLSFPPGTTEKGVSVKVKGDGLDELDETFGLKLSSPLRVRMPDPEANVTILDDDGPGISVADHAETEGDVDGTADVPVTLGAASPQVVTVEYAVTTGTAPESATPDVDLTLGTRTVTFEAGETVKTIPVAVEGDDVDEIDETYLVTLSNPTNATISDSTATGTIDDDDGPGISVGDVVTSEGNSGSPVAEFTVSLDGQSPQPVAFDYATGPIADNTTPATAGSDYTASDGEDVVISAGQTTTTVSVPIIPDTTDEVDETFALTVSNVEDGHLVDGDAVGTIDDDDGPTISIADVQAAESSAFVFGVTLSAPSPQTITVAYATSANTASSSDFTATSGTLEFPPTVTSRQISVEVANDPTDEFDETFFVTLSTPTNASISDASGTGTIVDNDNAPGISISDTQESEGNAGTNPFTFTVTLSAASAKTVTVSYATQDNSAVSSGSASTGGSDYGATNGPLTFDPGDTSLQVNVPVNSDTLNEPTETFFVNLSSPSNASISKGMGTGTITNDDSMPTVSINDASATEGDSGQKTFTFTVSLSAPSAQAITVQYATQDQSAVAGTGSAEFGSNDYAGTSGTLEFAAGQTSKSVDVTVNGDTATESNEIFRVVLSTPTNATPGDVTGLGTITTDDPSPSLSVDDISATEGNSGTKSFTFTITKSRWSGQTVTVQVATSDGSATAGSDYTSRSATVTFSAGTTQLTQQVSVSVIGDESVEGDETFSLLLSNASNALIADGQGQATILNDD